jgi:Ca-activated chloride channel family protein
LLLAAADANELPKRTPQQEIQIAKQAASRESWAEAAAALARAQEGQGKVDSLLAYDQAVAAYRAGDLTQAAAAFERALNSGDPEIAAAAAYNLGNTNYQLAMAPVESEGDSKKQLDQAADRFAQALEQYRHAIEQNSLDRDARANGELAWQKLQEVLQEQERQEQQEQEQEQEQDQQENAEDQEDQEGQEGQGEPQSEDEMNQDQQKSDDQEKQEEPSGQQKKEQQQQSEEQKQQEQEQPEDDQQSQDEQQQPQNQEEEQQDKSESQPNQDQQDSAEPKSEQSKDSAGGQSKTPGKMTKEEAERMLQSIRDREKQRRQDQQQIEAAGAATTGKDW